MKKIIIVAVLGVLAGAGHFAGRALRRHAGVGPRDKSAVRTAVPLGGDVSGAEDAAVNIVQFSDFECHFCNVAQATVKRLQREHGSQIRVFFRHAPMPAHQQAALASQAALAAGAQGKSATFINGRLITGAKPYDQFKDLIEDELARARTSLARKPGA